MTETMRSRPAANANTTPCPTDSNEHDKTTLRTTLLQRRAAIAGPNRRRYAEHIHTHLILHLAERELTDAPLLLYRSLASEVDTTALFDMTPQPCYAPVTAGDGSMQWRRVTHETVWQRAGFGVEEPQNGALWRVDEGAVVIAPLVGFDRTGTRLGMGMGCYDRWLATHRAQVDRVIGIAFSCQEVAKLPREAHDAPLDAVITEREVIVCRKQ